MRRFPAILLAVLAISLPTSAFSEDEAKDDVFQIVMTGCYENLDDLEGLKEFGQRSGWKKLPKIEKRDGRLPQPEHYHKWTAHEGGIEYQILFSEDYILNDQVGYYCEVATNLSAKESFAPVVEALNAELIKTRTEEGLLIRTHTFHDFHHGQVMLTVVTSKLGAPRTNFILIAARQ